MAKLRKSGSKCTLIYPRDSLDPSDLLHFVELRGFTRVWDNLGYSDEDLNALQILIMCNPRAHPVVKGTKGLRKMRFGRADEGKSGGVRVCFVYFEEFFTVLLAVVYPESEKVNLNAADKRRINKAITRIETTLKERFE